MEKRTIIALLLALVILFVSQMWLAPKQPAETQKQPETTAEQKKPEIPAAPAKAQSGETRKQTAAPQTTGIKATKEITVTTPLFTVAFSDLGGAITSVRLRDYKESVGSSKGKEIFEEILPYQYMPALVQSTDGKTATDGTRFSADKGNVTVRDRAETITFSGTLTDGRKVKKSYTFSPDSYVIGMKIDVESAEKGQTYADIALISLKDKPSYIFKGPFVYNGKKLEQIEKIDKDFVANKSYTYAGFDAGYFSFIWIPEGDTPSLTVTSVKGASLPVERFTLDKPQMAGKLYFGPNKIDVLKSLNVGAEKIVDFGWFDVVAKPMLWGMNYSNRVTHNYGIDIILLTILIKIIFYPLSYKSYKSMKNMQKLQPQIAKLKEKFKDEKEKLNKELMDMYKRQGANPLGGCLPMVIQIPVFFALYKTLMGAIEFRHAPFMLWINDLASPEDLFTFTVAGYALPIRILPLIMGITMVMQQKMTPTAADPLQEKMMLFMPIFFTFLFWGFPAGLVLYWLVNNVISIAQQYYINKKVA